MALSKLSADEHGIILSQLLNPLEPRLVVYFSSASSGLRLLLTPALQQQLRADHEVAAALCLKVGLRSCKELRKAKNICWENKRFSAEELATLGSLGSVLPSLEELTIIQFSGCPRRGVQRLAVKLGAGALPAMTSLCLGYMPVNDAGASALAAALGRGALPRLESLALHNAALGDAGLLALAPALRRLPALEHLNLERNLIGDEGLAALVAPPPPLPLPTAGLTKLKELSLFDTKITDAGCAALAAALESGALPALVHLNLNGTLASAAAKAAVEEALTKSKAAASSLDASPKTLWMMNYYYIPYACSALVGLALGLTH
eukprot:scaffold115282_cov63-Phaeocystis_antarctica.AAC.3